MSNQLQNKQVQIKKEINLLQDKLKQTKKRQNVFQKGLKRIIKTETKKDRMKKILQNKIKQIKREINLLQDILEQFKKRQNLLQNGLKRIAKMQNLSQNELDKITKMQNLSRDELEQITEMRRIKSTKKMSKEGLIIALLKSKRSLSELFSNDFDNDRIGGIKKILNELRDRLTNEYRRKIKKKLYKIKNKKNLSKSEKEEINEYFTELERILNKKEKYCYHDHDDPHYYGIRDIEVLLGEADEKDY